MQIKDVTAVVVWRDPDLDVETKKIGRGKQTHNSQIQWNVSITDSVGS